MGFPREHGTTDNADRPPVRRVPEEPADGNGSSRRFLADLLIAGCRLGPAAAGAVLQRNETSNVDVLSLCPGLAEDDTAPPWLSKAAELVNGHVESEQTVTVGWSQPGDLYGQTEHHILLLPLKLAELPSLAAAFLIRARDQAVLGAIRERLELSLSLVNVSETRNADQEKGLALQRLRKAMDTLSAVNRHRRFGSTTMALCNELASQWQCERGSLGVLKGRYVQVKAISHTDDFSRKMQIVQDIESAMEECLDQDCEVIYPSVADAMYVSRSAAELSKRHGPMCLVSFPLRRDEKVQGVVTLERPSDRKFKLDEIEAIRLSLELCTARLLALREEDRWIGAKVAASVRQVLAAIVGPKHTWAKIATILISAAILFLILAKGNYRAEASFVLEGTERQVVPAPFEGYIKTVDVEVGDVIRANDTVLAELDTVELRLQLAAAKAEKAGHLKQSAAAMRDGETAQAQIAQANAKKVQAQMDLYLYMIEQAQIVSPLTGTLVEGDLKRQIGAPVKTGDVLFEVTPLDSLRAVLHVKEDQIVDVQVGQAGRLATASYPGQRIRFEVEQISPMAEVVNQENIFKVRAHLLETPPWMRPGMEGVAKIDLGHRSYAWMWTRKIVNWVRMKLWW